MNDDFNWLGDIAGFGNAAQSGAKPTGFWGQLGSLPGGLPGLGLSLGSKLLGFLGGLGAGRKKKELYGQLGNLANIGQKQIGKPLYDVADIGARTIAGANPTLEKYGKQYDERYGFTQGRSAGAFKDTLTDFLGQLLPGLYKEEAVGRSSRDRDLLSIIAGIKQAQGAYI